MLLESSSEERNVREAAAAPANKNAHDVPLAGLILFRVENAAFLFNKIIEKLKAACEAGWLLGNPNASTYRYIYVALWSQPSIKFIAVF